MWTLYGIYMHNHDPGNTGFADILGIDWHKTVLRPVVWGTATAHAITPTWASRASVSLQVRQWWWAWPHSGPGDEQRYVHLIWTSWHPPTPALAMGAWVAKPAPSIPGFHHLIPPPSVQDWRVNITKKKENKKKEREKKAETHWRLTPLLVLWKDYSTIMIVK